MFCKDCTPLSPFQVGKIILTVSGGTAASCWGAERSHGSGIQHGADVGGGASVKSGHMIQDQ